MLIVFLVNTSVRKFRSLYTSKYAKYTKYTKALIAYTENTNIYIYICMAIAIYKRLYGVGILEKSSREAKENLERTAHHDLLGFLAPYFDLEEILFTTPLRSPAPLITWYFTPGKSWQRPPLTYTIECSWASWPSPGIYADTTFPLVKRTLHAFLCAEFGFLGFKTITRNTTPFRWGHWSSCGAVLIFLRLGGPEPLLIWFNVACIVVVEENSLCACLKGVHHVLDINLDNMALVGLLQFWCTCKFSVFSLVICVFSPQIVLSLG